MVNVLLVLAFVTEPLLWYKSASAKFSIKYKKAADIFMIIDLLDSLLGQYTNLTECIGQALHSLLFFTYIGVFICCAFEGSIRSKLRHIGTMFVILNLHLQMA